MSSHVFSIEEKQCSYVWRQFTLLGRGAFSVSDCTLPSLIQVLTDAMPATLSLLSKYDLDKQISTFSYESNIKHSRSLENREEKTDTQNAALTVAHGGSRHGHKLSSCLNPGRNAWAFYIQSRASVSPPLSKGSRRNCLSRGVGDEVHWSIDLLTGLKNLCCVVDEEEEDKENLCVSFMLVLFANYLSNFTSLSPFVCHKEHMR